MDGPKPWWLVPRSGIALGLSFAFLALLPFSALYNVPLLVLCGLGFLGLASRRQEALGDAGLRLLLVLFLCVWLPMTISAVDAVNPVQSWRKVVSFPVFFLAGAYVVMALRRMIDLRCLLIGVLVLCAFWSIDASWQFVHGFNLLGFPYQGGRLSGIFHPDLKLGIVLATVSPFVLEAVRQLAVRCIWVVLTLIPFFAVIALSGSRSSWIVVFVVLGCYGWYLLRWVEEPMARGRTILRVAAVGVLGCGLLVYAFPQTAGQAHALIVKRAAPLADLASSDRRTTDIALVARLTAWESAGRIFRAHWINGVGPRGFRDVHPEYAPAHDPYVKRGRTMTFPHLLVLEIAVETGAVGLLGYLAALVVMVRKLRSIGRARLALGFPYGLAIFVVLFPFATHQAFYAHFMGAIIWWTVAVSAAGLGAVVRSGHCADDESPSRAG